MTTLNPRRPRVASLATVAVAVAVVLAIVLGGRLVSGLRTGADSLGLDEPMLANPPAADDAGGDTASSGSAAGADAAAPDAGYDPVAELARIRADVDFWGARVQADPGDIVAAVKLAETDTAEARMTGDVTAYVRAEAAADTALRAQPGYVPAQDSRATILVALHRFPEARDLARQILDRAPGDATALGVLGDASLELGDLGTAGRAYGGLTTVADGSASRVRAGHLAFITGDTAGAVANDRAAVSAALDEGLEGDALGFYHLTLGEMLLATGDAAGARDAYAEALAVRPGLPAALIGLAKLDAFGGDLDGAIKSLDAAIAAVPLPDSLARRADLLERRAGPGDAAQAAVDRATVEAIAKLAGGAAYVYDRGMSLYLSDHGLDANRAVRLAADELKTRRDVYGYDALAWALLNAGRPSEAAAPMQAALAAGTRDARLWYHAGLVAAANGSSEDARRYLREALDLGPALDPVARDRAAAALGALR